MISFMMMVVMVVMVMKAKIGFVMMMMMMMMVMRSVLPWNRCATLALKCSGNSSGSNSVVQE
jgi:hypothetical protein